MHQHLGCSECQSIGLTEKSYTVKFRLLILFSSLLLFAAAGRAQVITLPLAAGDTAVNTGTASKVIGFSAGYQGVAIQAVATEISGTSAGTIKLQGSLDGTNYTDIASQSYTVTDVASQSTIFYVAAPLPRYIKVLQTGSGTMSSVLSVKYVPWRTATQ